VSLGEGLWGSNRYTLTLRCRAKCRHYHLITSWSSMNHYILDIVVDNVSVESMVDCDLLYFVVGFLLVFDTDSQSITPLREHL
jgi:hypothetical protein